MSSVIEALGMSLPLQFVKPSFKPLREKKQECIDAGKAIRILLEKRYQTRDTTRKHLQMRSPAVAVLGGSTKRGDAFNCNGNISLLISKLH
jgi:dihydroxy-acid dehydratase